MQNILRFPNLGTSEDGQTVTFTSTLVYSGSYRFSKDMVLQLNGSLTNKGDKSVYSGMITLPQNSSFGKFHMKKGKIRRFQLWLEFCINQNQNKLWVKKFVECCPYSFFGI